MQIAAKYSHLNGYEWLLHHRPDMWKEVEDVVAAIDAEVYRTKISKEKTMLGKRLFAPTELNKAFKRGLELKGWGKPDMYKFYMSDDENLTRQLVKLSLEEQKNLVNEVGAEEMRGWNQADFFKDRVSLEVQFGKYSFVQFDLFIKHAANFMQNKIDLGIEIVPMKIMEREMSSGPPVYEKHLHEILRQGRIFPPVPLILVGVAP